MPVVAPASVYWLQNEYYGTEEEFVFAVADALHEEYKGIVDAGFLLQVDDAVLVHEYDSILSLGGSFEDYRRWAEVRIEALNHALAGIPEERVRYHVCFGSWHGPHVYDPPLADVIDLVLKVRAGAYSIEQANPRHEHEWRVWEDVKLPDGKVLIPGVVTHHTTVVEHPAARRRPDHAAREDRRPRQCHRGHRLRIRAGRLHPASPSVHPVGKARSARRGSKAGHASALGLQSDCMIPLGPRPHQGLQPRSPL